MLADPSENGVEDHTKLKELILYVSAKCRDHSRFGGTKLNKILFFADFIAYAKWGKSITGETYFKLPMGPAPKKLLPVREELRENGELALEKREVFAKVQERPIALRPADLSKFESREIALVDDVIQALRDKDAAEVSELSHYFVGWQLAQEQEDIPYETVFIRNPDKIVITERRKKKAQDLANLHGLYQ